MELTQEYFDQQLKNLATKNDLKDLATKSDVESAVTELAGVINKTIAEPMEKGFAELRDYKTVKEEVNELKADIVKIKHALHLS